MYQMTLKTYGMSKSYHSLKSENTLKILNWQRGEKLRKSRASSTLAIRQHVDLSSISLHTTAVIAATIMFG